MVNQHPTEVDMSVTMDFSRVRSIVYLVMISCDFPAYV